MIRSMLLFHAVGDWAESEVLVTWQAGGRRIVPEVERIIDAEWSATLARPGVRLFDGPMCRLESWGRRAHVLELRLSETSYRPFLGTNLLHPELADRFGREVLANPVGVSPALETSDQFLLMGRRNDSVAYYPDRTHPFAGALEPRDGGDVFRAVRRELFEELSLNDADIAEIRCTGIAEDLALRQPELILRVRSGLTRDRILSRMNPEEHRGSLAIPATESEVAGAVLDPRMTPVGVASLLLWGRIRFGARWLEAAMPRGCSLAPGPAED